MEKAEDDSTSSAHAKKPTSASVPSNSKTKASHCSHSHHRQFIPVIVIVMFLLLAIYAKAAHRSQLPAHPEREQFRLAVRCEICLMSIKTIDPTLRQNIRSTHHPLLVKGKPICDNDC